MLSHTPTRNYGIVSPRHRRAPAGWDEERGEESGDVGDAPLGVTAEACGHCACACRADDVWAAYRVRVLGRRARCDAVLLFARGRVEAKVLSIRFLSCANLPHGDVRELHRQSSGR